MKKRSKKKRIATAQGTKKIPTKKKREQSSMRRTRDQSNRGPAEKLRKESEEDNYFGGTIRARPHICQFEEPCLNHRRTKKTKHREFSRTGRTKETKGRTKPWLITKKRPRKTKKAL